MFTNNTKLGNNFHFKDQIPKNLKILKRVPIRQTLVIRSLWEFYVFTSCYIILMEWTFYYFIICMWMSATVHINGTAQFTFFLVMRLTITIVKSCDFLILILVPNFSSLNLENGLKKHLRNVAEIKFRSVKLVVTFFILYKCDYVI